MGGSCFEGSFLWVCKANQRELHWGFLGLDILAHTLCRTRQELMEGDLDQVPLEGAPTSQGAKWKFISQVLVKRPVRHVSLTNNSLKPHLDLHQS